MKKIIEINLKCSFCNKDFIRNYRASKKKDKGIQFCCNDHRIEYYKINSANKNRKFSDETKIKMSVSRKLMLKNSDINKGEKHHSWKGGFPKCKDCGKTLKSYKAVRCSRCSKIGENSPIWKGGIVKIYERIRHLEEYKIWRKNVYERDIYCCRNCGKKSKKDIEAHHIKSVKAILNDIGIDNILDVLKIDILWDISNGTTLCKKCHKDIHDNNRRTKIWD
jgi:hypothetical protein